MSDEWSAFEDAPAEPAPAKLADALADASVADAALDRLSDCAEALMYAERELAACKECRTRLILEIESLIPETHDGPLKVPGWTINVERGERWSWDKDILDQLLAAKGLNEPADIPPFITKSTGIVRKKFDMQPEEVRREWMPALTRQKGATKITVHPDDKYKYEEL